MTKVVIGRSKIGQRSVLFNVDFRLSNTSVEAPIPYRTDEDSKTELGKSLLEKVNELPGIEHVMYRPFSFHIEIGWAFEVTEVIKSVLEMLASVCKDAEDPTLGGEIDLHYVRSTGTLCPVQEADFESALREMHLVSV